MLRRFGEASPESPATPTADTAFPGLEQAFTLQERSLGVRFYRGRESFFHPYVLLQSLTLKDELLTLAFANAEVTVAGRGLHSLYVHLADQRVAAIVEQGERYGAVSEAAVHITKIGRLETAA